MDKPVKSMTQIMRNRLPYKTQINKIHEAQLSTNLILKYKIEIKN